MLLITNHQSPITGRGTWRFSGLLGLLTLLALLPSASATEVAEDAQATRRIVVLLHGLGRSNRSMAPMEEALMGAGYRVQNIDYPSTDHDFERLVELVGGHIEECCIRHDVRVDFVTHSLGGIILRAWAQQGGAGNIGRAVMLSPPNHGSEIVDTLKDFALFQWILGPTALELGTDPHSVPNRLGPVRFEAGVITGDWSWNPVFSRLIPGPDDGKVSVESARVEGMGDFLVLPSGHPFIMGNDEVIRQTLHFLEHGRFSREQAPAPLDRDEEDARAAQY